MGLAPARTLQPRGAPPRARLGPGAGDRDRRIVSKGGLQAETKTTDEITFYQAVPLRIFEDMTACLPPDLSSFSFIDIGSGKGRALILAGRLGFREAIGVEFSSNLHRIAEKNLARVRGSMRTTLRL